MARIIYSMLVSLDGYIAGPGGDISMPAVEGELHRHFNDMMRRTSMELYGRRMYEVMRFWDSPDSEIGTSEVDLDFARAWQETPKIVFSTTLKDVGPNARLVGTDVEKIVRSLKSETDGDISVAGAELAASLSRLRLVDEYRLYVHPVVLGGGKPYFQSGLSLKLKPLGVEKLPQDVTMLRFAPAE